MHIVTQLSGRFMALYTQALEWLKVQLWHRVKHSHASFIRVFQNVRNLYLLNLLRVQTVSSFNRLRVSLITAVQLIKAGISIVKAQLIQTGLQLATIAHQTLQLVITVFKMSKGLVAKIKLVLSRLKENKIVQILMAHKWTQAGLKLLGTVRQRQQRAQRQNSKGR